MGRKVKLTIFAMAFLAAFPNLSESCTSETHRPRYHFSAKRNWINDPNGMFYQDGVFHLYYQYHPDSTQWGPMHWGHAVSRDLATWEEVGIALYPDDIGYIFSGSAVIDKMNTTGFKQPDSDVDPVIAIYTSASGPNNVIQRQSIAVSQDNGMTFTKYHGNPVLSDESKPDFRDPKVSFVHDTWIMALAVRDRVEFFSSPNLVDWRLESEFGFDPMEGAHGGVWECPDLIWIDADLGDGRMTKLWVLIVSINPGGPNLGSAAHYFIGNFTRNSTNHLEFHTFPWSDAQWLDWGPDNYAGVTFHNFPSGKSVFIGWMTNWMYAGDLPTETFKGQMTIPRELSIKVLNRTENQYRLMSNPSPELSDLRNPFQHVEMTNSFRVPPQTIIQLTEQATFTTPTMELDITLNVTGNAKFSICAFNSEEGEETCFGSDGAQWYLDRAKSGNVNFNGNFERSVYSTAKREVDDELVNIRIFLDVTSMEVFADGGLTSMTALHFPTKPFDKFYINHWSSAGATGGVSVERFDIWGILCWFP